MTTPEILLKRGKFCAHFPTTINIEQRQVTCDACGAVLDPFAVLASIARNRDGVRMQAMHARNEINRLQARVEELKREERNTRARLRRRARTPTEPPPASDNVVSLWSKR